VVFDIINIPPEYQPEIADLPGALEQVAEAIEAHIPGQGVRLTLILSQVFAGQYVYFRNTNMFVLSWRNDRIRADYDLGGVTVKALASKYRLCQRSVEKILSCPSSQKNRMSLL